MYLEFEKLHFINSPITYNLLKIIWSVATASESIIYLLDVFFDRSVLFSIIRMGLLCEQKCILEIVLQCECELSSVTYLLLMYWHKTVAICQLLIELFQSTYQ